MVNYNNMTSETVFVERNQENFRIYNSLIVEHRDLGILNSEISMKIIEELSRNPLCAMDIVRNLGIDKQKVYYHLKKLEESGVIKLVKNEQRHGMTAKIYEAVAPVVSTKLYEDFQEEKFEKEIQQFKNSQARSFFHPFIDDGKLNAKIIVGNPYPHGEYEMGARDGQYVADIALMFGNLTKNLEFPCYKMDTQVRDSDLKNNLILIGNPQVNTVSAFFNEKLPIYFDSKKGWNVVSRKDNKIYDDDNIGVILITDNPLDSSKKIMLLAGKRSRGTIAAVIALTQNIEYMIKNKKPAYIVRGVDKDGDDFIDYVHFVE